MKIILDQISANEDSLNTVLLEELIGKIRPSKAKKTGEAIEQLQNLIAYLRSYPHLRAALGKYVFALFVSYDPVYLYTNSGILSGRGFISEFWSKTKHKLLPEALEERDARTILNRLFFRADDFIWIEEVPVNLWTELLELLGIYNNLKEDKKAFRPLVSAIQLLSHNIATLGLDIAITRKLPHLDKLDSPFLVQNKVLTLFVDSFQTRAFTNLENEKFNHLIGILNNCVANIMELRRKKNVFGTSLHLTYLTRRLLQQIDRLKLLLHLFHERSEASFQSNLIQITRVLVRAENQKTSLSRLINDNVDLLAFEIVEHSAQKGGKYIADNIKEYWRYLRASMLGGFIIAFFASFKILADGWSLSPLGQGLLFSLNYALCFVLVQLLGGIIATKQPAMTASAVVRSIDTLNDNGKDNLSGLKDLIIKVSRSQFIAFVGNLICAFPIAYMLAKGYQFILNDPFISDYKATTILHEIHPAMSGALFFACIAGVFLSLSGLISGYFDNKVIFSRIPQRIQAHPLLIKWFSRGRLKYISNYIEKNLGVMAGNISLGFLLGMAGTIGFITGLPIDIRHIAFSSANVGFALENGSLPLNYTTISVALSGIAGIGLLNFLVSFGVTLFLAMKSRKITFGQTRKLTSLLRKHFFQMPLDFFIHPDWRLSFKKLSIRTLIKLPNSLNQLRTQDESKTHME